MIIHQRFLSVVLEKILHLSWLQQESTGEVPSSFPPDLLSQSNLFWAWDQSFFIASSSELYFACCRHFVYFFVCRSSGDRFLETSSDTGRFANNSNSSCSKLNLSLNNCYFENCLNLINLPFPNDCADSWVITTGTRSIPPPPAALYSTALSTLSWACTTWRRLLKGKMGKWPADCMRKAWNPSRPCCWCLTRAVTPSMTCGM